MAGRKANKVLGRIHGLQPVERDRYSIVLRGVIGRVIGRHIHTPEWLVGCYSIESSG